MMSNMLRSTGQQHHRGSGGTLLAERDRLMSSIIARRGPDGGVPDTIKAVGDYLHFRGAEVPWLRMYEAYPPWQRQSGLLSQALNKEAVLLGGPTVFFTLMKPHSRTALGGGTWKGTGKKTIGDEFVYNKLYYKDGANRPKEDGFTAIEFLLKIDEPRVAICVLHKADYRRLIQDLRRAAYESVGYHPAPQNYIVNPPNDLQVNGEMYGITDIAMDVEHPAYEFVHQHNSMYPSNTLPRNGDMNDMMGVRHHLDPQNYPMNPFNTLPNNGGMYDATSRYIILGGGYHPAPQNYIVNPPNDLPVNGEMYGITDIAMDVEHPAYAFVHQHNPMYPSNTLPRNGDMLIDMMTPNFVMPDDERAADEVSMQNSSITSFGNSSDVIPPNQNATLQDYPFSDNDLQDRIGDSDRHQLAGFFIDDFLKED